MSDDDGHFRPYPWWTRIWPLSRIYFAGWERGQEFGIERGRFQMGATLLPFVCYECGEQVQAGGACGCKPIRSTSTGRES